MTELAGIQRFLHADVHASYNQLYRGGAIRAAACLAHLRRKIFHVHDAQPAKLSIGLSRHSEIA